MPFLFAQESTDKWIRELKEGYFDPSYIYTQLGEEYGELGKSIEESEKRVAEELSDIIFAVTCMANKERIKLDEEWQKMMKARYHLVGEDYQLAIGPENSLDDIQKETLNIVRTYDSFDALYRELGIQVGSLAREVMDEFGPKKKKADERESSVGAELANVLYTTVVFANKYEINLSDEWNNMVEQKLYGRDKDRYEKKEEESL